MKIIIVDTNIVFSAILNAKSIIGEILFQNGDQLEFYTSEYLREEIDNHRDRILELSKTNEQAVNQVVYQVFKRISFISAQQIPFEFWASSASIVRDIDMDDLPFVALTKYLDGDLWTGDMELLNGLRAKGFDRCVTTKELIELLGKK